MTHSNNTPNQVRDYLTVAAMTLLIVCALPILAVMALTLQFSFLIVAPVLLISIVVIKLGRRSSHNQNVHAVSNL